MEGGRMADGGWPAILHAPNKEVPHAPIDDG